MEPQTSTVVAIFSDRATAERAAQVVSLHGLPAANVHLHERGTTPRNAAGIAVDEYATGGFFTNFASLLSGLLDAKPSPGIAQSYAEVVRFDEVALSVDGCRPEQLAALETELRAVGALKVASTPR